jgi:hypothetical protein
VTWRHLPGDEDWLLGPALADPPLCTLRELRDGTYDLADVALMNDALMVRADNERTARRILEDRRGKQ